MGPVGDRNMLTLTLTLLGFLLANFSSVSGIKCWECNSAYDKRCGDPFNNYTSELVDCDQKQSDLSHLPLNNGTPYTATICRKTVQTVRADVRVIRSCGWIPNPPNLEGRDCYTRTGTNQVMVYHCACKEDGCNAAPQTFASFILLLFSLYSLIV